MKVTPNLTQFRYFVVLPFVFCFNQLAAQVPIPSNEVPTVIVNTAAEPMTEGIYQPTWESLQQYTVPEWFKNAKFGIWAHWGPQCAPEAGDWYARFMYYQDKWQYNYHVKKYGHPSQFGFKDVIHSWKAENWDPDRLVKLYKRAGAQYFFAMANHHDNFDLWESSYQPWNSVNMGPEKDLIAGWAEAAKKQQLPFGLSIHSAHAWIWYESSRGADKTGDKAGVPYDGNLTKANGTGTWWEGYDPQDLYAQNHPHSEGWEHSGEIHKQWNWWNGANLPDQKYCENFYNRTVDLINKYHPDLLYFDDTALPLWPISDAGLKIAAHFYNSNMTRHDGNLEAVLFGKILTDDQRKAMVWDIEKGMANEITPYYWQTCSCIGGWHYDRNVYEKNKYKNATKVIEMLVDIVSKNGNLLLNIPVRSDGTIDEKEEAILEGIANWMDINKECIFDTRPWVVFGEGPGISSGKLTGQGFNENRNQPYTPQDIRFTTKENDLYAIIMNADSDSTTTINALALNSSLIDGNKITEVKELGSNKLSEWEQTKNGLDVKVSGSGIVVLKINGILSKNN